MTAEEKKALKNQKRKDKVKANKEAKVPQESAAAASETPDMQEPAQETAQQQEKQSKSKNRKEKREKPQETKMVYQPKKQSVQEDQAEEP